MFERKSDQFKMIKNKFTFKLSIIRKSILIKNYKIFKTKGEFKFSIFVFYKIKIN
jgi:hypothetical protein